MCGTELISMLALGVGTLSLSQLSGKKQEIFRQLRRNQGISTSLHPAPSEALLRFPAAHSGEGVF